MLRTVDPPNRAGRQSREVRQLAQVVAVERSFAQQELIER